MPSLEAQFLAALFYLESQDQQTPLAGNPKHVQKHAALADPDIFSGATVDSEDEDDLDPGEAPAQTSRMQNVWNDLLKKRFLDTIACIFARDAKLELKHCRVLGEGKQEVGGDTAAHVTATAMDAGSTDGEYHIYIAKNMGLDEHDKTFAMDLFKWMNGQAEGQAAENETAMFSSLVRFAQRRTKRLVANLLLLQDGIPEKAYKTDLLIKWTDCKKRLKASFRQRQPLPDDLDVDGAARTVTDIQRLFDDCTLYAQWFVYREPARQSARRQRSAVDEEGRRLLKLCDIINLAFRLRKPLNKYFTSASGGWKFSDDGVENDQISAFFKSLAKQVELLGVPAAQMAVLREVASSPSMKRFVYTDVIPPPPAQVDFDDLKKALEEFPQASKMSSTWMGKLRAFKKTPHLFRPKTHCEMQLLLFCDRQERSDGTKFHPYFGVSKKSCWACAQMIQRTRGQDFHTKGTHGRVMGLWAVQIDAVANSMALTRALVSLRREVFRRRNEAIIREQMTRAKEIMADILKVAEDTSNLGVITKLRKLAEEHDGCLSWRPNPATDLALEAMSSADQSASIRRDVFGHLPPPREYEPRQVQGYEHAQLEDWVAGVRDDASDITALLDGTRTPRSPYVSSSEPSSDSTAATEPDSMQMPQPVISGLASIKSQYERAVPIFVPQRYQILDREPPLFMIKPQEANPFTINFDHYAESWGKLTMPPRKDLDGVDMSILTARVGQPVVKMPDEASAIQPYNYRNHFRRLLAEEVQSHRKETDGYSRYTVKAYLDPLGHDSILVRVPELADGLQFTQRGDIVRFRPLDQSGTTHLLIGSGFNLYEPHWKGKLQISGPLNLPGRGLEYSTPVEDIVRGRELRFRGQFLRSMAEQATFIVHYPLQEYPYRCMLQVLQIIQDWFDTYDNLAQRANESGGFQPPAPWLRSMLFPDPADGIERMSSDMGEIRRLFYDQELNPEQQRAVDRICRRNYGWVPFLISGPPGTGKTKTLVEAAMQLLEPHTSEGNDERILICAPSEAAADMIAIRIADRMEKTQGLWPKDLLRLNLPSRGLDSIEMRMEKVLSYCAIDQGVFKVPEFSELMRKKVVVTTCLGASLLVGCRLTNSDIFHVENFCVNIFDRPRTEQIRLHWTALIIDEATQATEPMAAIPLAVVTPPVVAGDVHVKPIVVMAGDEHQLSPKTHSKNASLMESMFVRLFKRPIYSEHEEARTFASPGPSPASRSRRPAFANLLYNYRSHPAILAIPSKAKYGDTLKPAAPDADALLGLPIWKRQGWPVLFVPNTGEDTFDPIQEATWNNDEIALALTFVIRIHASSMHIPQADISVMSPFRKNVARLRQELRDHGLGGVDVRECDEFQGLEKRIVILCTTRTKRHLADIDCAHGRGLFGQPNRLTVCQTRARHGLVVIGNPNLLAQDPHWHPYLQFYKRNGLVDGDLSTLSMVPDGGSEAISKLEGDLPSSA